MENKTSKRLIKLIPQIQFSVPLKNYTTFKIGGQAKYFFTAKTKKDLIKAAKVAKKLKIPFCILGGGSKLLVPDQGVDGFIIKTENAEFRAKNNNIFAEAGLPLQYLIKIALNNSLAGIEWAAGIPGTVGGAVRGNAGAFGKSMKDVVKKVTVFRSDKNKIVVLKNQDCKFRYRNNIFKKNPNFIILSCEIQLKKGNKKEIRKEMEGYLAHRKKAHPLNFPSAGSIFENPKKKSSRKGEVDVMVAGLLIKECGLAGKKIGNIKISEKHSNFIVNLGKGKADDVKKLIALTKEKVKKKSGITLKEELQYLEKVF